MCVRERVFVVCVRERVCESPPSIRLFVSERGYCVCVCVWLYNDAALGLLTLSLESACAAAGGFSRSHARSK